MPSQPNLFESVPTFDRQSLAAKIRTLAERRIFIGTSSWRYEGWLGQVYTPERYFTRGKFSKKKFHEECILEYAETFPIIGGDFSFYSIPEASFWQKLLARAPQRLRWDLKIPEDFTTKRFSNQPRYGLRAGHENPTFLDPDAFQGAFLEPLAPYLDRVGVCLIEFGTFSKASYAEPKAFFDDLNGFLRRLPRDFQYAVEIRNDDFLDAAYFDVLKANRVAHIFTYGPACQACASNSSSTRHSLPRLLPRERFYVPVARMRRPSRFSHPTLRSGKNTLRRARLSVTSSTLHGNVTSRRTSTSITGWKVTRFRLSKV
jgi:uncharacterized protein YecE (DUF72 family)